MKGGNEPKDANARMKPKQQKGEELGKIKQRQLSKESIEGRSDTPRGSEPEMRSASGRRG